MNSEALVATFVVAHLPDSLQQRKQLLAAVLDVLPKRHPLRTRISAMLTFLETHENQQLEFAALLK